MNFCLEKWLQKCCSNINLYLLWIRLTLISSPVPITLLLFISVSLCMCKRPWWSMFIHRLTFLNNSNSSLTVTFLACWISRLCFIIHCLHSILHLRCWTWIILLFRLLFLPLKCPRQPDPTGELSSQNTAARESPAWIRDSGISTDLECNSGSVFW